MYEARYIFMVNTICLSMIVKNESKIITRMLESVSPIIDSYCICDTGSTDDTVEVIEHFFREKGIPGKIVMEPFKNFCHNRNVALNACHGMSDYILLMDADMTLTIGTTFHKDLLNDLDQCSILQGNEHYFYPNARIIKNNGNYQYHGVTHEYVCSSKPINHVKVFEKSQIFINDIGDGGCKSNKFDRDIELLKQGIVDEPENTRYYYYLGNSYHDSGKNEEAIEIYKKVISMHGWVEERYNACIAMHDCYCRMGQESSGIHYLILSHKFVPNRVEGIYKLVKYYGWQQMYSVSYAFYSMIQDYFENEFYDKKTGTLSESIGLHLFATQCDYKYYLPYYMIIAADKLKNYSMGVRMFEIIFAGNYLQAGEWFNNNLIYNLQYIIHHVPKENTSFFISCEKYLNAISEKHAIVHTDLMEKYRSYFKETVRVMPVVNDKNLFLFWTGREYSLILLLRKLIYAHSNEGENYRVHLITRQNVESYIKELPECFDKLMPAHQADFIRVHVICEYGGIWLDSDTLVMNNLQELFDSIIVEKTDGFFIKQNNEILWNGVFGSKANTPLLKVWRDYIDRVLFIKEGNIEWEEIGNTFLQKTFQETDLFSKYTIFNGLDTMYPVNYPICAAEFIDRPQDHAISLKREFQPLIALVHSVYRRLENMKEDEFLYANNPLSYFIRESYKNANISVVLYEKKYRECDKTEICSPRGYTLHIEKATYGTMNATLLARLLTMKQSKTMLQIKERQYNEKFGDPQYNVEKKFIVSYSFRKIEEILQPPERRIPKILFQCSKGGIPGYVVDMVKSQLTDEWKYIHFNDEEIIQYMRDHPSDEFPNIIEKFNSITWGPHKADLFRYYYLYTNGGVYLDSDAMIYQPIEKIVKDASFFTCLSYMRYHIFNGLIGATPRNGIILDALRNAYHIDVNVLYKDYQLFCRNLYNIIVESQDDNIVLYQEVNNGDNNAVRTEDHEGNTLLIHYPITKIVPNPPLEKVEPNLPIHP